MSFRGTLFAIPPKATPTAIPSGMLWIVIADIKSILLFKDVELFKLFFAFNILSKKPSDINTNIPPSTKASAGSNQAM